LRLIEVLFPHLAEVHVEGVEAAEDGGVRVRARAHAGQAVCPRCGAASSRVHSRYGRRLADVAIGGRPVLIELSARKFFCDAPGCPQRIFAEQVSGLTARHRRASPLLRGMWEKIAWVVGGRPGARLAGGLAVPTSRWTLLRLLRAAPEQPVGSVRVVGIDDFAVRKGQIYSTVVIDMETHQPIDVLPDREAETVKRWLAGHPEVEIICRDRAGAYASGAATGAPQAIQVADRFHLWQNLGEAVDKIVFAHRGCLAEPVAADDMETEADQAVTQTDVVEGATELPTVDDHGPEDAVVGLSSARLVERTRERYEAIAVLRAQGKGLRVIARELELDRKTVRRFATAASVQDLLVQMTSRAGLLDDHLPYLQQRWNDGCTNVDALFAEIRQRGYRGSVRTLYRHLQPLREASPPPPRQASPPPLVATPKPRRVARWIMTHPDHLSDDDQLRLTAILDRCPQLRATRAHVGAFAVMIRDLRGDRLDEWADRVLADNLSPLRSFINGLRGDLAAVTAGLTLPWSNGPTEGTITRIKSLKRAMFGRANPDLLRRRILHRQ
jgi:transposase